MIKEEVTTESGNNSNLSLLGDYLKRKRLDKNFSLEKLSQKTKISVNILKCLEANDFEHLPSAAYIKGFVKSYVKVLGLPLEEAISNMEYTYLNVLGKPFPALNHTKTMTASGQASAPKTGTNEEAQTPHEMIENSKTIIENTKSALPLVIFSVIVLIFIGGYRIISSVVENEVNSTKEVDLGPKIESSSALVKQPAKPAPANTELMSTAANSSTTATSSVEAKPEEVKADPNFQRNFPSLEFKKIRSKLFTVKNDAPENEDENVLPTKIRDAVNSDLQNIYIRATDGNTWVSYKIDSNPIESVIINQGSDLFLQGQEVRVFFGNLNVTKIFYNNHLIEAPTKTGLKSLIFPEESNSKYLLPLFPKAKDDILYTAEDYMKRMKMEEEEVEKRKQ